MDGSLVQRGVGWYLSLPEDVKSLETTGGEKKDVIPHVAGITVLGMSYAAAAALVAVDGPFPFGDAVAAGIILVPDVVWYGIGYALFD